MQRLLLLVLGALMGAPHVVRKTDYDKINSEKQDLLKWIKDIDKIKLKLLSAAYRRLQNAWFGLFANW